MSDGTEMRSDADGDGDAGSLADAEFDNPMRDGNCPEVNVVLL